jgi:hypothetical protein
MVDAREYKAAWTDAVKARDNLIKVHKQFVSNVEHHIEDIEAHTEKNKNTQRKIAAAQVAAAALVIATGGVAMITIVGAGCAKWGFKHQKRVCVKHCWNEAVQVMETDHRARTVFIKAVTRAKAARDALCEEFPDLKRLGFNTLAAFVSFPGVRLDMASDIGTAAAMYAVEENPELVADLLIQSVLTTFDIIGPCAAFAIADVVVDGIPLVGLTVNVVKFLVANKALKRGSKKAAELRELYTASQSHYNKLEALIAAFDGRLSPRAERQMGHHSSWYRLDTRAERHSEVIGMRACKEQGLCLSPQAERQMGHHSSWYRLDRSR